MEINLVITAYGVARMTEPELMQWDADGEQYTAVSIPLHLLARPDEELMELFNPESPLWDSPFEALPIDGWGEPIPHL